MTFGTYRSQTILYLFYIMEITPSTKWSAVAFTRVRARGSYGRLCSSFVSLRLAILEHSRHVTDITRGQRRAAYFWSAWHK